MTEKENNYQRIVNGYQIVRRDPDRQREAARLSDIIDKLEESGEISRDVIMGMKYF